MKELTVIEWLQLLQNKVVTVREVRQALGLDPKEES